MARLKKKIISCKKDYIFTLCPRDYQQHLLIQSKPIQELKGPQSLLNILSKVLPNLTTNINTLAIRRNLPSTQRSRSLPNSPNRLSKAESIKENIQRPTSRIQRSSPRTLTLRRTSKRARREQ